MRGAPRRRGATSRLRALALAMLLCCAAAPLPLAGQARDTTLLSAERAALAWLAHLDTAAYERAWAEVVPAMRGSTTYAEWTTSLEQLRSVLPPSPRRALLRAEHGVPLFGGASVLLRFGLPGTGLREIVVLVRERARWRIGGYGVLL